MKLQILTSALALTLSGMAFASDYYPPERLHCKAVASGIVDCDNFDRQYLTEDVSSDDLPLGKEMVFMFTSGAAYFTPNQAQATVFFSYHDSKGKLVRLKTTNYDIKPNLQVGGWEKFKEDIYVCRTGYMSCPVTSAS